MSISRKHFRKIASIIEEAGLDDDDRFLLTVEFAEWLAGENDLFNVHIFMEACGVEGEIIVTETTDGVIIGVP